MIFFVLPRKQQTLAFSYKKTKTKNNSFVLPRKQQTLAFSPQENNTC